MLVDTGDWNNVDILLYEFRRVKWNCINVVYKTLCLLRYSVIRKRSQFLELVWNSCDRYWISECHNKSSQILCWLKSCLWYVRDLWSRVTLAMVLTENKSKCLLVVNHTRITIHHHPCSATALVNKHQISILQFSIGSEVCTQDQNLQTNC